MSAVAPGVVGATNPGLTDELTIFPPFSANAQKPKTIANTNGINLTDVIIQF